MIRLADCVLRIYGTEDENRSNDSMQYKMWFVMKNYGELYDGMEEKSCQRSLSKQKSIILQERRK